FTAPVLPSSAIALLPILLYCVCLPSLVRRHCSLLPICFNSALFSKVAMTHPLAVTNCNIDME
ncbi:hypothetical protein HN51_041753, partial [Arachis hypogaea]